MSSTQKTLLTLTLLGFGVFLLEMARVLNLSLFSLWFGVSTALTFCCVSLKNAETAPEKWLYGMGVLLTFVLFFLGECDDGACGWHGGQTANHALNVALPF